MSISYILRNSIGKSYRIPRYITDRQNNIGFTYRIYICTYNYITVHLSRISQNISSISDFQVPIYFWYNKLSGLQKANYLNWLTRLFSISNQIIETPKAQVLYSSKRSFMSFPQFIRQNANFRSSTAGLLAWISLFFLFLWSFDRSARVFFIRSTGFDRNFFILKPMLHWSWKLH